VPLREKINKLLFRSQSAKPAASKESKYWKVAFGMSKQEVIEYTSEDFR
jgi:hypothetical protein